jgi:hypothetical protein
MNTCPNSRQIQNSENEGIQAISTARKQVGLRAKVSFEKESTPQNADTCYRERVTAYQQVFRAIGVLFLDKFLVAA